MQRLLFVLYQMDQARLQIEGGRLEQLRLALLLLDNAAELQVERRVSKERGWEDIRERIRARWEEMLAGDHSPEAEEKRAEYITGWVPLTAAEKRKLDRYFDRKLDYLVVRHGVLDAGLASVLSHIHRYRNEAYHEGRVRNETVRTAALILLEANCQLLKSVFQISYWSSAEDYSWVTDRFGLSGGSMPSVDLDTVISQLRDELVPTLAAVVDVLTSHLRNRIEELWDALDLAADSIPVIRDRAHALVAAQEIAAMERGKPGQVGAWTLEMIQELYESVDEIRMASDRLEAFGKFATLEEQLEPIETEVNSLAAQVDRLIQDEVDRLRGK